MRSFRPMSLHHNHMLSYSPITKLKNGVIFRLILLTYSFKHIIEMLLLLLSFAKRGALLIYLQGGYIKIWEKK